MGDKPSAEELIALHPAGDLSGIRDNPKMVAARYAKRGAEGGGNPWWTVWKAIQSERGMSLDQRLEELNAEQLFRFALWSFVRGEVVDGVEAYERYLRQPVFGVERAENQLFYDALIRCGRSARIRSLIDENPGLTASPADQLVAVRLDLADNEVEAAHRRLVRIMRRYRDLGELWLARAVTEHRRGETTEARIALVEAAKQDVLDEELLAQSLVQLGASAEDWQGLRALFEPPDYRDAMFGHARDPGMRLVPSTVETAHRYGGDSSFATPACAGCGHPIRVWFTIDLTEVSALRDRVPWRFLPLLGCADCGVWMGRHDYRIDESANRIELLNVAIDTAEFGRAYVVQPPLSLQFVALETPARSDSPTEEDLDDPVGPFIGGQPPWTQQPERVFCPECRDEMVYVAAMSTTQAFDQPVPINNESGFQYHFVCAACSVLSVLAQWT